MTTAEVVYTPAMDVRHRALRGQFLLAPGVAFLNHGSFGACPRPVFERYQAWQLELERQPVEFLGRRSRGLLAEARAALGGYLGADADELVYVPNVTTALNVVARSLHLEPGDEVLTADQEYGALTRTWQFVTEQRGARLVVQTVPTPVNEPAEIAQAVWAGVTPRTRVLFLSHVTSPTGMIQPIEALIQRAREAGIWTVIDGAHAPGQIPVDLHALDADFYGGNCHKWLCAPKGAGFLFARRDVQHLLEPLVISWGWRAEEPGPSRFVDEQEQQATRDLAAYLSVPAAIEFLADHNWAAVQHECHALARVARDRIAHLTGLPQLVADSAELYAQMAALPLPGCDARALKQLLYDEYQVEVPVGGGEGLPRVRVSIQGYNTLSDITRLVDALSDLLPRLSRVVAVAD
jgi:isopenicillin-N epimerase